jgi:uroporphyrinogen decarboxylase
MNSRERVIAALTFSSPDRTPFDLWVHKATAMKYGEALQNILERYPHDIEIISGPGDRSFYDETFTSGTYTDEWGSGWKVIADGMVGEVFDPAIKDPRQYQDYRTPDEWLAAEWKTHEESVDGRIAAQREKGKFVLAGTVEVFQRMQFIRGSENLLCDIGLKEDELFFFRDMITRYFDYYLDFWLDRDIDGILFKDDWGSQISLLISPSDFSSIFKPAYVKIIKKIKDAGKYVFFHSDGYVFDLYREWIDLGVDAINSQLWIMNLDDIAAAYAGRICFWGEIDRQRVLAFQGPNEIRQCAEKMIDLLEVNGGGLIGQSVAGVDVSLENIETLCTCWNRPVL